MSEKNYGYFGTYPKDWKRGDPLQMTVHVIYQYNNFHTPNPIPCNGCKQVILSHKEVIEKHIDNNEWVFVKHANYKQEYGMTDFYETIKEIDLMEQEATNGNT